MLWFFEGLNNEGKPKLIIEEDEMSFDNPRRKAYRNNINYKITQIYGSGKKYLSFSYFVSISKDYNFISPNKKLTGTKQNNLISNRKRSLK